MARRQALLLGDETPDIWRHTPNRDGALVAIAGEKAVREAELAVTLHEIDRAWRDHLAQIAVFAKASIWCRWADVTR